MNDFEPPVVPNPAASAPAATGPRRLVFAVGGGIACYKAAAAVSRIVQAGLGVQVLMSEAATRFVTPLTFRSLSGREVVTSMWDAGEHPSSPHVGLARDALAMLVAPATADLIARLAHGRCDEIIGLTACALPRQTPLLLAPAMNAQMWENPITQRNVQTLSELRGVQWIGPDTGYQACRTQGAGRMVEPTVLAEAVLGLAGSVGQPRS